MNVANVSPGTGWIRGDQAIDPKVLQDLERLRIENEELRRQLGKIESLEIHFPSHLAHPDDEYEAKINVQVSNDGESSLTVKATWKTIFMRGAMELLGEQPESKITSTIARSLAKRESGEEYKEHATYDFHARDVLLIKFHLEAIGLIKITSKGIHPNDYTTWALTEKGRQYLVGFLATKKKDEEEKENLDAS